MEKFMIHAENIFSFMKNIYDYQDGHSTFYTVPDVTNWDILFDQVKLKYEYTLSYKRDSDEIFPNGLSLNIRHGQKVGLCGRTGSGKTSFMKLLFQIASPTSGSIKIGQINIQDIDKNYLM
ncbi:Multidrug resistance-associated protein 9 [Thelohanellus kitauei]|uniref:Multidrug resistance-associated protein 9 n=1 Tax=Thelohanellus kitauei TaxID=669202 RepID=A0A0C2I7Y9_THEKT|nr:Multidrug resistance-associated protein 9 [Thelohanellus kitauei]